jgi:hypothetical protein
VGSGLLGALAGGGLGLWRSCLRGFAVDVVLAFVAVAGVMYFISLWPTMRTGRGKAAQPLLRLARREDSFLLLREGRMTRGHGIYLIIGLVASFFGGAFLLIAYLMAFEDYAAVIVGVSGGIGSVGWYIAFCCGRMGTSNFDKLE